MARKEGLLGLAVLIITLIAFPLIGSAAVVTIDVWTDMPVYNPNDLVTITGQVLVDGTPSAGVLVIVTVKDPTDTTALTRLVTTNATGHFEVLFNVSTAVYANVYGDWEVAAQISGGPTDTTLFIVGTPAINLTAPDTGITYTVNDTVNIAGVFYVKENNDGIANSTITIDVYNGTGALVFSTNVATDPAGNFATSFTITQDMVTSPTTFNIVVADTLTGITATTNINVEPAAAAPAPPPPGGDLVGGVLVSPDSGLNLLLLLPLAAGIAAAVLYKINKRR